MAVWLVTGGSGFLGRHVLDVIGPELATTRRGDDRVVALGRRSLSDRAGVEFVQADLDDPETLGDAVAWIKPDFVLHTAGKTPPADDDELYRANFWSTNRLLVALRELHRPVRAVLVGSAAELGPVPAAALPVGERYACDPTTVYGRSKWMATVSATSEKPPLEVMVARLFNPIGPGLPEGQAFGRFAALLRSPAHDPLHLVVGRLDARRDFVDVRDAARALIDVALRGKAGEVYHVGTGRSRSIQEGLDFLLARSGRAVRVRVDAGPHDRRDPEDSRACIDKIMAEIGWSPSIPFERSMEDLWAATASRTAPLPLPLTA